MQNTQTFSTLTKIQKQAVWLLSLGTFVEYFDFMLYIHTAIFLNGLFFPKTDPFTAQLLLALSFCVSYVFRPFGALLFGYLGDKMGRKAMVVMSTTAMSLSCLTMFILPTYAQIGIASAWIMLICRASQGIFSQGEAVSAKLYLTETIKRPAVYPMVGLVAIAASFGAVSALGMASLTTSYGFNWRYAFLMGAGIAVIGAIARTRLLETPDFIQAKKVIEITVGQTGIDKKTITRQSIYNKKIEKSLPIAFFLIQCSGPACFYLIYTYCASILTQVFNQTAVEIIHHNLAIAIIGTSSQIILIFLSYKLFPLKILKVQLMIFIGFILMCPYLLSHANMAFEIFLIQAAIAIFAVDILPAGPIFYSHFPIFKRSTYANLTYALSRTITSVIVSFGLIYLTKFFGYYGLLVLMLPILAGYAFGLRYFEKLELKTASLPDEKQLFSNSYS